MTIEELQSRGLNEELKISASRSSGAGGQNVNKVNTKVEVRFHIQESQVLSENEKALIYKKLATRISNEGYLIIFSQDERSQVKNKEIAIGKFYDLIIKALTPRKKRKATAPTGLSKEKRLQVKRKQSEKKELRKKIE
jgi:ribosome-associated protein